jgi:hypothetical protein
VIWSLELPATLALARLVCQHTGAPWSKVLAGECPDDVDDTGKALQGLPLYLVGEAGERGAAIVKALLRR